MLRRISNIDRIKLQLRLNQQVKELLQSNEIDLDKPFHFEVPYFNSISRLLWPSSKRITRAEINRILMFLTGPSRLLSISERWPKPQVRMRCSICIESCNTSMYLLGGPYFGQVQLDAISI